VVAVNFVLSCVLVPAISYWFDSAQAIV